MKLMCYNFDFKGEVYGYGFVYAKNEEEARKKILNQDYDDVLDTYEYNVTEITNIEEDKFDTIEED